jgi:hypothetical protein
MEEKLIKPSGLDNIIQYCDNEKKIYENWITLSEEKRQWLDTADDIEFVDGFHQEDSFSCGALGLESRYECFQDECKLTDEFAEKWSLASCIDRAKEATELETEKLRLARKEVEEQAALNTILKRDEEIPFERSPRMHINVQVTSDGADTMTPVHADDQSSEEDVSTQLPPLQSARSGYKSSSDRLADLPLPTVIQEIDRGSGNADSPLRMPKRVSWESLYELNEGEDDLSCGEKFDHDSVIDGNTDSEGCTESTHLMDELVLLASPKSADEARLAAVDVLGVELWPPNRTPNPVTEKLTFVMRFALSEVKKSEYFNVETSASQTPRAPHEPTGQPFSARSTMSSTRSMSSTQTSTESLSTVEPISPNDGKRSNNIQKTCSHDDTNTPQTGQDFHQYDKSATSYLLRETSSDSDQSYNLNSPKGISSAYQYFCATMRTHLKHQIGKESAIVFTVRRDLASLCAFHAKLINVLSETEVQPPPFPDPFLTGNVEDEVKLRLLSTSNSKKRLRFGQPFVYGKTLRKQHASCNFTSMGTRMETLKDYRAFDESLSQVQSYLQSVIALIESIDDDFDIHTHCDDSLRRLPEELGKLFGQFLQAADTADIIEDGAALKTRDSMTSNYSIADALIETFTSPRGNEFRSSRGYDTYERAINAEFPNKCKYAESCRPCFYPYATSGLALKVIIHDEKGSYVGMRKDEELLRAQRSKCLGCGQPLQSGLFGLDKNFTQCRYLNGLFCHRWCHAEEQRVIPHRLLLYWDCKTYKVSRQAAAFLDHFSKKPVLQIDVINPLLYQGVPTLRFIRNVKNRISNMLEVLMEVDASHAYDVIVDTLGVDKIHVCTIDELLSVNDLIDIENGAMAARLQRLLDALISATPPGSFLKTPTWTRA